MALLPQIVRLHSQNEGSEQELTRKSSAEIGQQLWNTNSWEYLLALPHKESGRRRLAKKWRKKWQKRQKKWPKSDQTWKILIELLLPTSFYGTLTFSGPRVRDLDGHYLREWSGVNMFAWMEWMSEPFARYCQVNMWMDKTSLLAAEGKREWRGNQWTIRSWTEKSEWWPLSSRYLTKMGKSFTCSCAFCT